MVKKKPPALAEGFFNIRLLIMQATFYLLPVLFRVQIDFVSLVLGVSQFVGLLDLFFIPGFYNQGIRYQFPQVFGFNVQPVLFREAFHDLIPAVVAGRHDHFGLGVHDLFGLDAPVIDPLGIVGHGPGASPRAAAEVVHAVGVHFYIIFTTLLGNPSRFLKKGLPEGFHALSTVIARVMNGREFFVDRFIQLYSSFVNVLFEQLVDGYNIIFLKNFRVPRLQTKPGREVGVASLG